MTDKKLVVTRVLNAPIEKVWDAWTKPEEMMQWEAPEGLTTPIVEAELKVGGHYYIVMAGEHVGPTGKVTARGVYNEVKKPNKLVFTWKWDGQEEETQVSILMKPISDTSTELTLIHEGFKTEESKNEHTKGWTSTFNKLSEYLR